jgi:hypothetical protein
MFCARHFYNFSHKTNITLSFCLTDLKPLLLDRQAHQIHLGGCPSEQHIYACMHAPANLQPEVLMAVMAFYITKSIQIRKKTAL